VSEFTVQRAGVGLSGEEAGEGVPVVLLHGLTATRRYVVMGSRTLERTGHRVVLYDARGHGRSSPAPEAADYGYPALAADLLAVLDDRGIERAVLGGASMGAHTILRLALDHGDRVAGRVLVTPAYTPDRGHDDLARWDALSAGLRTGGVEGFVAAYGDPHVPDAWRDTVVKVIHQRLSAHEHPDAVADALRAVPRSRAFEDWAELRRGRSRSPVRGGRALRRRDPRRRAALGGAGCVTAGLAGRPALAGDRRARRARRRLNRAWLNGGRGGPGPPRPAAC
jgi:pimeloyl-ACP methyl ester carboxylesterase